MTILAGLDADRLAARRTGSATTRSRSSHAVSRRSRPGSATPAGPACSSSRRPSGRPIDGVVLANEVLDALPTHRVVGRDGRPARGLRRHARRPLRRRRGRPVHAGAWRTASDARRSRSPMASAPRSASRLDPLAGGRGGRPRARAAPADRLRLPGRRAVRPDPPSRRNASRLPAPARPRRPVPARRTPGPDRPRRRQRGRAGRGGGRAQSTSGRRRRPSSWSALGIEELLQAIQADPSTTLEDYLAVRSSLMRLLDPGAMGRFRVMGFGRAWPDGPPLAGFAYRLVRERTRPHQTHPGLGQPPYCRDGRLRSHASRRSGTTRRGAAREPARALGARRSLPSPAPARRRPAARRCRLARPHC